MARLSFQPAERKFFVLFEQSARNAAKVAEQLHDLVEVWQHVSQRVGVITDLEHEGDAITHQVITQLNRTFVTPIDREDIARLAHSLDDITDCIHDAADAMLLYRVEKPTRRIKELSTIVVQITGAVVEAVAEMGDNLKPEVMLKQCEEINRLENMGDTVYRTAVAELFTETTDLSYIVKWREIYKHTSRAMNRCEAVADVLEGIMLEYA